MKTFKRYIKEALIGNHAKNNLTIDLDVCKNYSIVVPIVDRTDIIDYLKNDKQYNYITQVNKISGYKFYYFFVPIKDLKSLRKRFVDKGGGQHFIPYRLPENMKTIGDLKKYIKKNPHLSQLSSIYIEEALIGSHAKNNKTDLIKDTHQIVIAYSNTLIDYLTKKKYKHFNTKCQYGGTWYVVPKKDMDDVQNYIAKAMDSICNIPDGVSTFVELKNKFSKLR